MKCEFRRMLLAGSALRSHLFFEGEEANTEVEELDENDPRVQKVVKGLKSKNQQLIGSEKSLKERLKAFEGLDPEEVKAAVEAHRKSQEKTLIDEGKIEELFSARTERMRQDHDAQLSAKDKKIKELEEQTTGLSSQLNKAVLGSEISAASLKNHVRPQAIGLVEKLAADTWRVEDGRPKAYDSNGPIMGKDTKPISMEEWVSGLRADHGYLFKESSGGGAENNGSSTQGGGATKRRSEMSVKEKSEYISKHGQAAFRQLPA